LQLNLGIVLKTCIIQGFPRKRFKTLPVVQYKLALYGNQTLFYW